MIAHGFVAAGASVIISARKAEACQEAAERLSAIGSCTAHPADVASPEGVADLIAAVSEGGGRLDVLVNNAGATWGVPLEEYPRGGLGQGARHQRQGRVRPDRGGPAAAARRRQHRRTRPGSSTSARSTGSAHRSSRPTPTRPRRRRSTPSPSTWPCASPGRPITVNAIAPGPFDSKMMVVRARRRSRSPGGRILGAARSRRPARRHGRHGDLPRLPGRRLPHRGHHPGGRRHHRPLTRPSVDKPLPWQGFVPLLPDKSTKALCAGHRRAGGARRRLVAAGAGSAEGPARVPPTRDRYSDPKSSRTRPTRRSPWSWTSRTATGRCPHRRRRWSRRSG